MPEFLSDGLERKIVDWGVSRPHEEDTGELSVLWLKFARPPIPQGVSKNQTIQVVQRYRGDAGTPMGPEILIIDELRCGLWAKVRCVGPAEVLCRGRVMSEPIQKALNTLARGKNVFCQVLVGQGAQTTENVDEVFWFAYLPPEVAVFQNEAERTKCMANFVLDLVERRRREELEKLRADGNALHEAQLKEFPARLPHEPHGFDHYKNRADVLYHLLRKDWPQFFKAYDNLNQAKTPLQRLGCQKGIWLAYIADHKAIYGDFPNVKEDEAAVLWRNDDFHRLMSDVLNAPRSHDKRSWQLANGWIEKNYYRMNEVELEQAFAKDWNYPPHFHKGNTLAKHARKIGLRFALKTGRREKPNSLPPG